MKDGYDARSIEELREHFDLESVLGYFADGRLQTWLRDRYFDDEAQQVSELDPNDSELVTKICSILGVEAPEQAVNVDVHEINRYNEKRKQLLEKYPEPELLNNIDAVAFNEDDIIQIIEKGIKEIYLIDNEFEFPFELDGGYLVLKNGSSLPYTFMSSLFDCKFIGKGATLHIDSKDLRISNVFRFRFENINFIFVDEGIELLFKGQVLKDIDAAVNLGVYYYDKKDYNKSLDYFLIAGEKGNALAQNQIGIFYAEGLGVKQDKVQATEWFKKAAEQGVVLAQRILGDIYSEEEDYTKAAEWYEKAAEQGDADAQFELGIMLKEGNFISKNINKAIDLLSKASEQGKDRATLTLASMYHEGVDVEIDIAKAIKYFKRLYEQNNPMLKELAEGVLDYYKNAETVWALGYAYEKGLNGYEKDLKKAIALYQYAAEQGDELAKESLMELGEKKEDSEIVIFGEDNNVQKKSKSAMRKEIGNLLESKIKDGPNTISLNDLLDDP